MARRRKPKIAENVHFTGLADRGKSVGRTEEGQVVFAQGPVPGDTADVLLLKKRKGVFQGVIKQYKSYSDDRIDAFCSHFEFCGGCKWQHLAYPRQLAEKEKQVRDAFERIAKMDPEEFLPIVGAKDIKYYRNKLEFSFSNKRWLTDEEIKSDQQFGEEKCLGFHAPGSFDKIVAIDHCYLQGEPSNDIRNFIRDYTLEHDYPYWDARKHTGLMRNLIIRTSTMDQTMVILSFGHNDADKITALLEALRDGFPQISSLLYVINEKLNDTLFDQDIKVFAGQASIRERLGELEFIVSPKSFFQTNTRQSKALYDIALDFADLQGDELVYDLYTGIGSIALYLAARVKKVIGIEVIEDAIIDAEKNAALNKIENAAFFTGDVKDILTPAFNKPDIIFIDPPRAGMHKDVVSTLLKLAPKKIVYISCNPPTQARDVALLSERYKLIKAQPVDMFPHSHHIENVVLLHLIK